MIIRRSAREKFQLDQNLLDSRGRIDLSTFHAARSISHRVNSINHSAAEPEKILRGAELYGLAMLDRIYRSLLLMFLKPGANLSRSGLAGLLPDSTTPEAADALSIEFLSIFSPRQESYPAERELVLDLICTSLINQNPAAKRIRELTDDGELKNSPVYSAVVEASETLFSPAEELAGSDTGILTLLRTPFTLHPESIRSQLEYIRNRWSSFLTGGDEYTDLLSTLGVLEEEERPWFGGGPGEQHAYVYSPDDREGFSEDQSWMPNVVMMARNTLVWLHQLSIKEGKTLTRLDEIPEKELETLAVRGFTALWLIGLWQRSDASKRIKHLCGNPDAEASAYSLKNYEISEDLGGWKALETLRIKAGKYGLRIASDMVPNHTGMDADWIYTHPDYYLQLPSSPYPSYTFSGENLSRNNSFQINLEDHYYDQTDAAVVFRHEDLSSGRVRYIYHGNDGTHMPWNDTAQLNYLNPEVRETVIQTILQVARNFPIIRFDAAMTLAREHIRRLWYPEPGKGGAVPSRAEHAISEESFNRALPAEFWRDVVDRVAAEVPGTLLLAEAFWMMEGYFVRSLGMHRVYNSAFMNMLKNEENEKYQQTLKNTLEFDPEILKRFVNFMNNPDEDTAVAQFGTGDKYFGICTMLVTMPGLPMFGHGQIEGFTEKYGMEYRRSYRDETPDKALIERHEKEIFPLLKLRPLFAEAENFTLFDLISPTGINRNVFAYTNHREETSALILYNNSSQPAAGTIRISASYRKKNSGGELHQANLGEALSIPDNPRKWLIMRLHGKDLEFIRNCRTIVRQGLEAVLGPYECQVFLDLRLADETADGRYRSLAEHLGGSGCIDIDREIRMMHMLPLHSALTSALTEEVIFAFREAVLHKRVPPGNFLTSWEKSYRRFLVAAAETVNSKATDEILNKAGEVLRQSASGLLAAALHRIDSTDPAEEELSGARGYLLRGFEMRKEAPAVFAAWTVTEGLSALLHTGSPTGASWSLMNDLHLSQPMKDVFRGAGLDEGKADYAVRLVKLVTEWSDWHEEDQIQDILPRMLEEPEIQDFLLVNRYNDIVWFNKDRYEDMVWWLFAATAVRCTGRNQGNLCGEIHTIFDLIHYWLQIEEESGYKFTKLLRLAGKISAEK